MTSIDEFNLWGAIMKRFSQFGVLGATAVIAGRDRSDVHRVRRPLGPRPLPMCSRAARQQERNEATVRAFYETAVNDNDPALAVELYVGVDRQRNKTYTQHNPFAADGPQAFIDFFTNVFPPEGEVDIKRIISECDLVVTHSHITGGLGDNGNGDAAMDIFRMDRRGKVVEHWDVVQQIPDNPANDNGMF